MGCHKFGALITQTAIGIREELSVFGNDYATPDGTCIRDIFTLKI